MRYEIYIDTLFLLNLGMNVYLLELTNCILHHMATWKRIAMGALCGSVFSVIPLLFLRNPIISGITGFSLSILSMSLIAFKVSSFEAYMHLLEIISVLTIVLGTVLQYILRKIPADFQLPVLGILLVGAVCYLSLRRLLKRESRTCECKVTLRNNKSKLKINALVDTGNSLIEPISGLPVAVLDKKVFENLFLDDKPGGFRVIPYHSIDKKTGLMPGYLIPEMQIEWNGFCREYRNIYVGIRQQDMGESENYKIIINPEMLRERKAG